MQSRLRASLSTTHARAAARYAPTTTATRQAKPDQMHDEHGTALSP